VLTAVLSQICEDFLQQSASRSRSNVVIAAVCYDVYAIKRKRRACFTVLCGWCYETRRYYITFSFDRM